MGVRKSFGKKWRILSSVLACSSVMLWAPLDASAEEFAKISATQEAMNTAGVQAIIDGDYDTAIAKFRSSLALGELNVTHVNLGRAYQKRGDCKLALESYDAALNAPKVELPTPEEIGTLATNYSAEIQPELCDGFVTVTCEPADAVLQINNGSPLDCSSNPIRLAPGKHKFLLINPDTGDTAETTVDLAGIEEKSITMTLVPSASDGKGPGEKGPDTKTPVEPVVVAPASGSNLATWGWVTGGAGAAMLGVALVLDFTILGPKRTELEGWDPAVDGDRKAFDAKADAFDTLRSVNMGLVITGGALAVTGVVLLLWPEEESTVSGMPVPLVFEDGVGLFWSAKW